MSDLSDASVQSTWFVAFERRVHRIKDLPAEIADAIQNSKMNPAHDHLNELLGKE